MSFDKLLRDLIREEISVVVGPLADAVAQLSEQGDLVAQLSSFLGAGAGKRGPGRPRKNGLALALSRGGKGGRARLSSKRGCAVLACKRPARSKGYCAAHYQKFRMLARTKRLPSDWVDDAPVGTVRDIVLPRGRAGAKALAEANKK